MTHMVCLTFDFDTMAPFVARGMTGPSIRSRGEFGVVGSRRILALLSELGIRSTWFMPGFTVETYPQACEAVVAAGHEISNHGWTHVSPQEMSAAEEEDDLLRCNEAIVQLSGRRPVGYRSPAAELSENTVDLLLKHGFLYDSTMMGDDYTPYHVRRGDVISLGQPARFGTETRLVEMPMAWSLDDMPHFEYFRSFGGSLQQGLMNANDVRDNWFADFAYMKKYLPWGIVTYLCHPFIIGRGHRMLMLERLLRDLLAEGAEFVTMGQAVERFMQRPAA